MSESADKPTPPTDDSEMPPDAESLVRWLDRIYMPVIPQPHLLATEEGRLMLARDGAQRELVENLLFKYHMK